VAGDYVHRIGRTGRAGAEGDAVSLVCVDERKLLMDIERLIKCDLPSRIIAGFEPDSRIQAEPITNGRSSAPRGVTSKQRKSKGLRIVKSAPKSPAGSKWAAANYKQSGHKFVAVS